MKRQERRDLACHIRIHGTIDEPVHALNLAETIDKIEMEGRDSTIIAIDACLGRMKSIGYISIKRSTTPNKRQQTSYRWRLPHHWRCKCCWLHEHVVTEHPIW